MNIDQESQKAPTVRGLRETLPVSPNVDDPLREKIGMTILGSRSVQTEEQPIQPLVSVITPTYNRSWSLRRTIQSVFDQTYRPIECIVVDDGSTDDTPEVIETLTHECPNGVEIRYFRKENGGVNCARNKGLSECRGDFICYLDSDDQLPNESISERAKALISDPEVDFCYGMCSLRDQHGKEIRRMNECWPSSDQPRISRYLFDTNSPLIKRSTCLKVGLWRTDDQYGQEFEYFARLKYFSRKVCFVDEVVSLYNKHGNESIFDWTMPFTLASFRIVLAVKALVLFGEHDNVQERQQLANEFKNVAKQLYRLGGYTNARAALQESLLMHWKLKTWAQWLGISILAVWNRKKPS